MTKNEALEILLTWEPFVGDGPSALNNLLTERQALDIVIKGIRALKTDVLPDIFEKRVWQVTRNQKRPKY